MKSLAKLWISSSIGRVLETARPRSGNVKIASPKNLRLSEPAVIEEKKRREEKQSKKSQPSVETAKSLNPLKGPT
jgi:hypothetical protein